MAPTPTALGCSWCKLVVGCLSLPLVMQALQVDGAIQRHLLWRSHTGSRTCVTLCGFKFEWADPDVAEASAGAVLLEFDGADRIEAIVLGDGFVSGTSHAWRVILGETFDGFQCIDA